MIEMGNYHWVLGNDFSKLLSTPSQLEIFDYIFSNYKPFQNSTFHI
ncbi:hypothetical protein Aazo_3305 ['Nostoc azollae' 0708]|uniref:Uncharacterized protein n=1 Tax=Nostoc azollae (strain 0708) TaxID=551115 RepID=D7E2G0_NOSA0|nr:hypothetical protein Aazo_3305 ['Nostoc azollae' 0708]